MQLRHLFVRQNNCIFPIEQFKSVHFPQKHALLSKACSSQKRTHVKSLYLWTACTFVKNVHFYQQRAVLWTVCALSTACTFVKSMHNSVHFCQKRALLSTVPFGQQCAFLSTTFTFVTSVPLFQQFALLSKACAINKSVHYCQKRAPVKSLHLSKACTCQQRALFSTAYTFVKNVHFCQQCALLSTVCVFVSSVTFF